MMMNTMYGGGYGSYGSYGGYGAPGQYPGMDPYSMGMGGPPMGMPPMGMPPMGMPQGGFAPAGGGEYQRTLQDSYTGGVSFGNGGGLLGGLRPNEGFGLDFNRNGRYDRGRDGVLVFDTNRDGRYDQKDVQRTNDIMKAAGGNMDFNNDGKVSFGERIKGAVLKAKFRQMDMNRDGRLDSNEIAQGGGRVWMDQNRNGQVNLGETSSPFNVPSNGRFGPTERLDYASPFSSHTSSNGMGGYGPFGGGGYPGCGCGGGGGYGYGQPNGGYY